MTRRAPKWSFLISMIGPQHAPPSTIEALQVHLTDRHPVIVSSDDVISISFATNGETPVEAIADGVTAFAAACYAAGCDTKAARCEVEVRTKDAIIEEITLALPEWMGVAEAATELGVSRQRVSQLTKDNPRFPRPIVKLSATPVWAAEEIRQFAKSRS